jgi:ribosomal protein L14E/L6E/L27E
MPFITVNGQKVFVEGKQQAGGTLPFKMSKNDPRGKFDVERIKGTDEVIVRQKGESTGTIGTAKDLDRILRHMESQRKIQLMIDAKMETVKKNRKFTEGQRKQIGELQDSLVR